MRKISHVSFLVEIMFSFLFDFSIFQKKFKNVSHKNEETKISKCGFNVLLAN